MVESSKYMSGMGLLSFLILMIVFVFSGCPAKNVVDHPAEPPKNNLWAWERPEELMWLEGRNDIGVAYLARTIVLKKGSVENRPRMQLLRVPPGLYMTAVTRIETGRGEDAPVFSDTQRKTIVDLVLKTLSAKDVRAVQIDFDATGSERVHYAKLIDEIRAAIPKNIHLSITAIASWCTGDGWVDKLPVDDVVPMVFDMGPDDERIRRHLSDDNDWNESVCKKSYGIADYDSVSKGLRPDRRYYHFSRRPFRLSDIKNMSGDR